MGGDPGIHMQWPDEDMGTISNGGRPECKLTGSLQHKAISMPCDLTPL